ncbi:hypothetical protein IAE37_000466 [Pseudomonas sp. S31]|uniref:DUF6708 domain-containing protein n=1 Tax=Pseudomonas sp. S31 TaxID=1564473 RepID=UPI001F2F1FF9|nr:DUF6708 domain-containing protein [Pseudomonas sp. S31]MBK4998190.1 hypothetical protein [Pseudomonas sp. S31]
MKKTYRDIGWQYDLPKTNTGLKLEIDTLNGFPPITSLNEIFLEIPLARVAYRGFFSIAGCAILLASAAASIFLSATILTSPKIDYTSIITLLLAWLAALYLTGPSIWLDLRLPYNEPIRFNRQRQKVYFYSYRFDRFRPFARENWGVKAVVYDWQDVTAEAYRVYLPLGSGGLVEKVMISVCNPETDKIIDRLPFADSIEKGEQYWAMAQKFMQNGPGELSKLDSTPNYLTREVHRRLLNRFAPEVRWPAEMDLESRTAPSPEGQL